MFLCANINKKRLVCDVYLTSGTGLLEAPLARIIV
jgi:hypothetical protein